MSLPVTPHVEPEYPVVEHRCTLCRTIWTAPVLECPHCGPSETDEQVQCVSCGSAGHISRTHPCTSEVHGDPDPCEGRICGECWPS